MEGAVKTIDKWYEGALRGQICTSSWSAPAASKLIKYELTFPDPCVMQEMLNVIFVSLKHSV